MGWVTSSELWTVLGFAIWKGKFGIVSRIGKNLKCNRGRDLCAQLQIGLGIEWSISSFAFIEEIIFNRVSIFDSLSRLNWNQCLLLFPVPFHTFDYGSKIKGQRDRLSTVAIPQRGFRQIFQFRFSFSFCSWLNWKEIFFLPDSRNFSIDFQAWNLSNCVHLDG